MKSFNEFIIEEEKKRKRSAQTAAIQAPSSQSSGSSASADPPLPSPPAVTQIVFEELLDQLIAARMIDGNNNDTAIERRDPDSLARRICQRIASVNHQILNDPNTPLNTRRVSYQITGVAYMLLLLFVHCGGGRNW